MIEVIKFRYDLPIQQIIKTQLMTFGFLKE